MRKAVTPRPFPWATFESVSYMDVAATRAFGRWGGGRAVARGVARALGEIAKTKVAVELRRVRAASRSRGLEASVAAVLSPADDSSLGRGVLVEVEGALAAALVARALGRPTIELIDPGHRASPRVAGAFAAIALAAARRAGVGAPLRVLSAGPGSVLAGDFARFSPDAIGVEITVVVEDEAHLARALVDRAAAAGARHPVWGRASLATLGDLLVSLPVVAAASTASAFEVAALAPGDVWLPGAWRLHRAGGGWRGPVAIAAPGLEVGASSTLGDDGDIVLGGDVEDLAWTPPVREGAAMSEGNDTDVLIEAVGEVPVVVRVEIGVVEMRARDWAAVGPGDIVALKRRVAEPVVLRVGGIEMARGELVEIEGDVGVRILERIERREARS